MPDTTDRYEIGGYFLTRHPNSPVWKAGWYDQQTGQTRRASLGTEDLQIAQVRLAEFVVKQATMKDQRPADMQLATVLVRYWEGHASKIASHEAAQYALGFWTDFWETAMVSDLTPERQEAFIAWLKAKGFKNAYVSRVLSVGRAAINRAWKRQEITATVFIADERDRSDKKEPYRLSMDEMRALLTAAQRTPHLFTFVMIMANTLARPDAVLDLRPSQVNMEDRRINLNPAGRKQTKKFRPIVPITDTLLPFVQAKDVDRFVMYHRKPVADIKKGFRLIADAAGLPKDASAYSLRHTMARELRRRAVPAWEVEGMLGHRRPGVTETYAEFDPSYLSKSREAIDAYFAELGLDLKPSKGPQRVSSVSVADGGEGPSEDISNEISGLMVGATGIEPVTPTMST